MPREITSRASRSAGASRRRISECAPSARLASTTHFVYIGYIHLDAKTQSLLGFIDAVQLITNITSVFHYEPFNNFGSWLTFPRANNIADIFQLVYLRISGNESKICTAFR